MDQHTLGEDFWKEEIRTQLAAQIQEEFKDFIREELPVRDLPAIDHTKTLATARFTETYAGETPHRRGPKLAPAEMEHCREILLELLSKGYIKPSASPFGAPVLLVPKPGSPRKLIMVIDYRAVNALCQSDKYPLPTIEELIGQMLGAKYFTTLDLLNGFWH